jgi:hypothetical protein
MKGREAQQRQGLQRRGGVLEINDYQTLEVNTRKSDLYRQGRCMTSDALVQSTCHGKVQPSFFEAGAC